MRYLLVLVLLAGCATPEQRAAREAKYIAELENRCAKVGFKPDTDAMAQCKLNLMTADRANETARAGVAAQNVSNMQNATKPAPVPPPYGTWRTY